ncbi:MAG TPA: HD domain-containing protein [Trebonia sp.]|nr:HD domain-containing protein [Trebonia sp.]
MRIPADEEIFALHVRHAPTPEALAIVYTHSEIVRRIAASLIDGLGTVAGGTVAGGIDAGLVRAGCLLHDIGVYRLYDAAGRLGDAGYIRHGVLGHELLAEAGYPEALCRFASRHTGVGITKQDVLRQELPLPPADYVAQTPEEALVMYADKFHTKSTPPSFLTPATYAAEVARFGADKPAAFARLRERFGEPDLAALSAAYGYGVR